jgi:pyridoxal phosphate enzyme (YggS family)
MMLAENLQQIKNSLPNQVCLVAVSKTKPVSALQDAYKAGQRHFGENKAQEMADKFEVLPRDIHWHFIGHLQTNKVKQIIDKTYLIHSMDRPSLFDELEKQATKISRTVDVLLQFHIAEEESKHGFSWDEAQEFLNSLAYLAAQRVRIVGVMGMATFTENQKQIEQEFTTLKQYFDTLKARYFSQTDAFQIISMGMSGDYNLAIACGSNMIRVGSAIFGER